ncbi:MAG: glycosyltransferase family 2 protein [Paracoccus sp. (in: a-proteobacteria)]|nr:glycosyltransferase family 2 protein [Paracoccus sp. (in: a-proteobacteria)]
MRHVLLTSMKDEGPYALEFIAHHRVLGFDAHHVATNDCSDGTDHLLDALAAHGIITHLRNELAEGERPQRTAYAKMRKAYATDSADWVMVLDADEFLFVEAGAGRIGDLTALAGPEIDVITLSSKSFGTYADDRWQPGLVTEQFTRRIRDDSPANGPSKSISRGKGRWGAVQNHNPVDFQGDYPIRALMGSDQVIEIPRGTPIHKVLRFQGPETMGHKLAWYAHYPVKSAESYLARRARGLGTTPVGATEAKERYSDEYWTRFARGKISDRRLPDRYGALMRAELARLLDLPGVAAAQRDALALYARLLGREG